MGGGVWGDVVTVGDIEEDIRVVVIVRDTGLEIRVCKCVKMCEKVETIQ